MPYQISRDAYGNEWIKCLVCGMGSYNRNDIEQRYCWNCKVFHEQIQYLHKSES